MSLKHEHSDDEDDAADAMIDEEQRRPAKRAKTADVSSVSVTFPFFLFRSLLYWSWRICLCVRGPIVVGLEQSALHVPLRSIRSSNSSRLGQFIGFPRLYDTTSSDGASFITCSHLMSNAVLPIQTHVDISKIDPLCTYFHFYSHPSAPPQPSLPHQLTYP
ncbi:hypothetical protein DL93DRAFT_2079364 [Clavulina sp. PMI_390]|nr:hypothetical protein DL93DRAFT_2079364 [Clavulina sp. PMI_390]